MTKERDPLVASLVEYQGTTYPLWKGESGVVLARDMDVAVWLEYSRGRNFRQLIERHSPNLGELRCTMQLCADDQGHTVAEIDRPGNEYYLTREQVLYLVAKSETSKATELLKAMITVFALAMDGKLGGSREVQELRAENERLRAQLKSLPQADQEEVVDAGFLARYGISIGKGMTSPTNPYKRPAPVWRVRAPWNNQLNEVFKRCWGRWYRAGKCWAFFEDPRRLLMSRLDPDEFYAQEEQVRGNA